MLALIARRPSIALAIVLTWGESATNDPPTPLVSGLRDAADTFTAIAVALGG